MIHFNFLSSDIVKQFIDLVNTIKNEEFLA